MAVDPVAGAGSPNVLALVEAELAALAADAASLRAILSTGDIVQARVLPSNGLTDLLEIAGQRVAASLPPTLRPGDVITVQVTGFDETGQIQVQILPDAPGASSTPAAPPTAEIPLPETSLPLPAVPNAPLANAPPTHGSSAAMSGSSVAPPAAVFVAASVRAAASPPASATNPSIPGTAGARTPPPIAPGITPESTQSPNAGAPFARPPLVTPPATGAAFGMIEARLAAARAAAPPSAANPAPPGATHRSLVTPPFVLRPTITARVDAANLERQSAQTPPVNANAGTASSTPARGLALYTEPVALLRALKLPVTPTNVASAKLALETPQRLPNALAVLERALPASTDPRVLTLRTLTGFLTRLEPQSPALAAQIAAYVDHVVDGSEPKLAQLLLARGDATAAQKSAPSAPQAPGTFPAIDLARAIERGTALQYDLKSTLLSLVQSPPPGGSEALATALSGALAAITALQVNAASTLAANPNGLAFAIPIALPNGIAQAHVRVDRDAPNAQKTPLDGDNFHIAFVLETQNFGVVAIDLVTVGRTVTVGVKTEATLHARAFGAALTKLTDRLEKLKYKVARADATVAAVGTTSVVETSLGLSIGAPVDPTKLVDRSA